LTQTLLVPVGDATSGPIPRRGSGPSCHLQALLSLRANADGCAAGATSAAFPGMARLVRSHSAVVGFKLVR
jgi:hypothetical protein